MALREIQNAKYLCPHSIGGLQNSGDQRIDYIESQPYGSNGRSGGNVSSEKLTSVSVPEVFNAYTIADVGFILMSKIPGIILEKFWPNLTRNSKISLIRQLGSFIPEWLRLKGLVSDLLMMVHAKMFFFNIHRTQNPGTMDLFLQEWNSITEW